MRTRILLLVIGVFLCVGAPAAQAQYGNCYDDDGNICLAQCGIFTQTGQDLGSPNPNGPYTTTALYPQCTPTCSGHAIGVDYETFKGYPCYDYGNIVNDPRIELLRTVVPGAPVFVASCSGSLVQVNPPRRSETARTIGSSRDFTIR
jgi:hypothetical protein